MTHLKNTLIATGILCSIAAASVAAEAKREMAAPIVLRGHTGPISCINFDREGSGLFSGSWDKSVRLWDWRHGREIGRFDGHSAPVVSIDVSSDGSLLASGAQDGSARVWDAAQRTELHRFNHERGGKVAFHPLRNMIAITEDGHVVVFDSSSYTQLHSLDLKGNPDAIRFSADGRRLLAVVPKEGVTIWDIDQGKQLTAIAIPLKTIRPGTQYRPRPWCADFAPNGRSIVIACQDGVREFDLEHQRLTQVLDRKMVLDGDFHTVGVASLVFSHDGKLVVIAGGNNALWIMRTDDWTVVEKLHGIGGGQDRTDGYFTTVAVSPHGTHVAAASSDSSIWIWELPKTATTLPPQGETKR